MTFRGRHPPWRGASDDLWRKHDLSTHDGALWLAALVRQAWQAIGAEAEVVVERVDLRGQRGADPMWRARLVRVVGPGQP